MGENEQIETNGLELKYEKYVDGSKETNEI